MSGLRIDHVTVAGSDLNRLGARFADRGLPAEYGGPHSNGITHMALLGFADGSYLELISTIRPDAESPVWDRHIRGDGGPAAWAVQVEEIRAEAERLRSAGIPVSGPAPWHRVRPDGRRIEWELAFPGRGPPGSSLPFLIQDLTSRHLRVSPSAALAGTELTGVAAVVLGAREPRSAAAALQRAYGWDPPEIAPAPALGATAARFAGTPVHLLSPAGGGSWLAARLERFGESPCAFLLGSRDLGESARRFALEGVEPDTSLGTPVLWLERPDGEGCLHGIGVTSVDRGPPPGA
ncbi:MAG: VOC family protein [Gemmatimonadota bacterium]